MEMSRILACVTLLCNLVMIDEPQAIGKISIELKLIAASRMIESCDENVVQDFYSLAKNQCQTTITTVWTQLHGFSS